MKSGRYFATAVLACVFLIALWPQSPCYALSYYKAYAPPTAWGTWECVGYHGGVINFGLSCEPTGDTKVIGEVKYYSDEGVVFKQFSESIQFTTGDCWAGVWVRFRGIPFGSMVDVFVEP